MVRRKLPFPWRRAAGRGLLPVTVCVALVLIAGCSNSGSPPAVGGSGPGAAPGAVTGGSSGAIGTVPSVAVTAPPAPTGVVAHPPATIASNCSVDVTSALQAWIDSVPDNSTLLFPAKACYRIDETLTFADRNRLLIDGNGTTLKAVAQGKRNRAQLVFRGGSDLTVRNFVVRGANPKAGATAAAYDAALEAQHAFRISGSTDVLLDHDQAYDLYGDFVNIGPGQKEPSRNITVANSTFARSGRQGISITAAIGVLIEANTITQVARSVFDLEANSRAAEISSVKIIGNVTGQAVNFWLANKGFNAHISNIQITGNRMAQPAGGLIFVYGNRFAYRGPFLISDNQFIANDAINDENSKGALFFAHATNVTITGNHVVFPAGKGMPAIELRDTRHVTATNNTFTNAGTPLIASQGSSDYHIS